MLLDGADELARFAGRADQQPITELLDDFAWQARLAVEEAQMRERDELVEIAQAIRRLCEQDDVVRALLLVVVVDEIALHAIDDLDIVLAFAECLHRIRECLHDAMIRDDDSGPAPAVSRLDEVGHGIDGIHRAHRRMCMELDALDVCRVPALLLLFFREAVHEEHVFVEIRVETNRTAHAHAHAILDARDRLLELVGLRVLAASLLEELLADDAVRFV